MTSLTQEVDQIVAQINESKERLKVASQEAFKRGFKAVFEDYPFLGEVAWAQYTPYFNDGEPCEFGVNEVVLAELGEETDGYFEDGEGFYSKSRDEVYRDGEFKKNDAYDRRYADCRRVAASLVNAIPSDVMRDMFGDHVAVRVTREGVDVVEYDHE